MLRKLLKYEFRATVRLYLPLYLAVLFLALLGRLSIGGNILNAVRVMEDYGAGGGGFFASFLGALAGIALVFYAVGLLGAYVVHFVITLQRFWKNLLGDEGYLMFTLPVSVDQLLWSKAIASGVWSFATSLVVLLSVFVLAYQPWMAEAVSGYFAHELQELGPAADLLWAFLGEMFGGAFWWLMAAAVLLDTFGGLFLLYASMAIGHTARRHKILASVGAYLGLNAFTSVAVSMVTAALTPLLDGRMEELMQITPNSVPELLAVAGQFGAVLNWGVFFIVLSSTILAVAAYFAARYLLRTQLNLE